ncbi:MAG: DUF2520 domain-containing protein [Cryobacterium sp.]|nr:DUF2520 domain-containing protein [Cryobacterium sp.]
MTPRSGRLGVGIIGSGKVGPVLGAALAGAGHAIIGISASDQESVDRVEAILPGAPILEIPELVERSELVVLAIPESQLKSMVEGLAKVGVWQAGQLVLHTVAGLGVGVLAAATSAGAIPLALHPALAFTGTSVDLQRLRESYCAVTAPGPVLTIAQALAVEIGAEPLVVAEEDRAAYGEAIATATSFSTAIVGQAIGLLDGIGVEAPGAVLASLIRSTVDNALNAAAGPMIELPELDGDDFPGSEQSRLED